jgi:hypothetical protein
MSSKGPRSIHKVKASNDHCKGKGKQRYTKWTIKLKNPNQNRKPSNDHELFYVNSTCHEQAMCKKLDPKELK